MLHLKKSIHAIVLIFAAGLITSAGLIGCSRVSVKQTVIANKVTLPAAKMKSSRKRNVRVVLAKSSKRITISSNRPMRVYDMRTKKKLGSIRLTSDAQIVIRDGRILMNGQFIASPKIRLVPEAKEWIQVKNRHYRGQIEIRINEEKGGLMVINYVPLEEYLYGVVPNEVPAKWPEEALKVQAVAARSFALYKMSGRAQQPYDLDATVNSQVYGGYDSEKLSTNRAVRDTLGQVMRFRGKIIAAFYHSNCGGHTANVQDVWGSEMAYLNGTACGFCDDGPHASWKMTIPRKELAARLRKRGTGVGAIESINLLGRDGSGRVLKVGVRHSKGKEIIAASAFRLMVGADQLKSTKFNFRDTGKNLTFWGKGWGHGVGMCQEGALGMAKSGFGYRDILRHFYPGADIGRCGN